MRMIKAWKLLTRILIRRWVFLLRYSKMATYPYAANMNFPSGRKFRWWYSGFRERTRRCGESNDFQQSIRVIQSYHFDYEEVNLRQLYDVVNHVDAFFPRRLFLKTRACTWWTGVKKVSEKSTYRTSKFNDLDERKNFLGWCWALYRHQKWTKIPGIKLSKNMKKKFTQSVYTR